MNLQELIRKRSINWEQLEDLCGKFERNKSNRRKEDIFRFSSLYRSACADLALAESYHLPNNVVQRLQTLVARAHSVLYSEKSSHFSKLFKEMPRVIVSDPYVHFCFFVFWIVFIALCLLVRFQVVPDLADTVVGGANLQQMEQMHTPSEGKAGTGARARAVGHYVQNNAGIGLMCFALSVVVIPGITVLISNAAQIGVTFGYLLHPDRGAASDSFQTFVMAHGPFELTAIVLSAGAGLRLGMSLVDTKGLDRRSSFLYGAQKALPVVMAAVIFFFIAAVLEGMVSNYRWDTSLMTYERVFKGALGTLSSWALIFYFVGLGVIKPMMDGELTINNLTQDEKGESSWI